MNLENTVKKASQILKNHNIHSHELDAQIILSDIMEIKREFLITGIFLLSKYTATCSWDLLKWATCQTVPVGCS